MLFVYKKFSDMSWTVPPSLLLLEVVLSREHYSSNKWLSIFEQFGGKIKLNFRDKESLLSIEIYFSKNFPFFLSENKMWNKISPAVEVNFPAFTKLVLERSALNIFFFCLNTNIHFSSQGHIFAYAIYFLLNYVSVSHANKFLKK